MCFSSIQLNGSLSIRWKSCGAKSRYIPKLKIKMIPREDEWKDGYRNCFLRLNHVRKGVLVGVKSLRGIYFSIVPCIMTCPTCDDILAAQLCTKGYKLCKSE